METFSESVITKVFFDSKNASISKLRELLGNNISFQELCNFQNWIKTQQYEVCEAVHYEDIEDNSSGEMVKIFSFIVPVNSKVPKIYREWMKEIFDKITSGEVEIQHYCKYTRTKNYFESKKIKPDRPKPKP